jgi:hypothetical protein
VISSKLNHTLGIYKNKKNKNNLIEASVGQSDASIIDGASEDITIKIN